MCCYIRDVPVDIFGGAEGGYGYFGKKISPLHYLKKKLSFPLDILHIFFRIVMQFFPLRGKSPTVENIMLNFPRIMETCLILTRI